MLTNSRRDGDGEPATAGVGAAARIEAQASRRSGVLPVFLARAGLVIGDVDPAFFGHNTRFSGSCWTTWMEDVRLRRAGVEDCRFLATMLGEAAVWRPDKPTPTADEVMADPRYAMYLTGWPRHGDYGLVADHDEPVGAAWYRTYTEQDHGYGFVAADVPELSIAVIASRRHEGIGRRLLVRLIEASLARGYSAMSLSVAEDNPARDLYKSAGFVSLDKHGRIWTMVRYADHSDRPAGR